jgi:hypothetical protein
MLSKWHQTDLDYKATDRELLNSRDLEKEVEGDLEPSHGRLSFRLKGLEGVTYQITTKGKLGIFYPDKIDYEIAKEHVLPFLVGADGRPVKILRVTKSLDVYKVIREYYGHTGIIEVWALMREGRTEEAFEVLDKIEADFDEMGQPGRIISLEQREQDEK